MRQTRLRQFAIATSTVAIAALFSVGWSVDSAQAERLYISRHPLSPYRADLSGLPWYAVRAYYAGGPWCGVVPGSYATAVGLFGRQSWTCYSDWGNYKQVNGIGCGPGTVVKGGDGGKLRLPVSKRAPKRRSKTAASFNLASSSLIEDHFVVLIFKPSGPRPLPMTKTP